MPYLLIEHAVEDYDEWKPHFDDDAKPIGESRHQAVQLFRKEGEPNEIIALFEYDTFENAHEVADSDDLRETMQEAGVVGEPDFAFLDKIEEFPG